MADQSIFQFKERHSRVVSFNLMTIEYSIEYYRFSENYAKNTRNPSEGCSFIFDARRRTLMSILSPAP